ncbi:MAG: D-alanine--D-alanine ligase [Pseudomonadales bacterium]
MNLELIQHINSLLTTPVAVLLGGESAEREVSLNSGAAICDALQQAGIDHQVIDASGDWLSVLQTSGLAHSFIALHGGAGEDGTVQGVLETLGISYTGSGVLASALAMDKERSKRLFRGSDIPTANWCLLTATVDWSSALKKLGGKAMVKPACEGSSVGMAIAANAEELSAAYDAAGEFDTAVIAEQYIDGPEYTVAVLDGEALPAIRLEPANEFYDYDAKYLSDSTRYYCPCGLSESEELEMNSMALEVFSTLGCKGWGRIDFMRDGEQFYVLEANTVPGMTDHSLVPMAAKAAGYDFTELVCRILAASLVVEA